MKHKPVGLEGLDDELIGYMKKKGMRPEDVKMLPEGKGWLMVELGGQTKAETDAQARALMAALKVAPDAPTMKLFDDKAQEHKLWEVRESGLGATALVPGMSETHPGWEDAAVAPENRLGDLPPSIPKAAGGVWLSRRAFTAILDRDAFTAASTSIS